MTRLTKPESTVRVYAIGQKGRRSEQAALVTSRREVAQAGSQGSLLRSNLEREVLGSIWRCRAKGGRARQPLPPSLCSVGDGAGSSEQWGHRTQGCQRHEERVGPGPAFYQVQCRTPARTAEVAGHRNVTPAQRGQGDRA